MAIPLSYNLRNLLVRKSTTVMTALGIALTVAVLVGIMAMVGGLRSALEVTGHPLHLIVTRQGSTAELTSIVGQESFQVLRFMEDIQELDGEPMASHEVVTVISLPLRSNPAEEANVNVRGLPAMGIRMREGIELLRGGRWFADGRREVVVGRGIHGAHAQTSIGQKLHFGRGEWEVVGIFDAGTSAFNSEIWGDGNLISTDLGRGGTRSSVLIRATDDVAAEALIHRVSDDQRLLLEAIRERDYYAKQTQSAAPVETLGLLVSVIMAIGSSFAAMNTMFAAIARRAKEIGVLRMLGFSRGSVLLSFLIESLFLSLVGGVLGCLFVLPLDGLEGRIGNFVTFSNTTFAFEITPAMVGVGIAFSAVMGVLGGLMPARMAAKRDILSSLRDI